MKITKFSHSCLLAEATDRVALFDPGHFTFEENPRVIDKIDRLDRIVVTHNHPDHMSVDFISSLVTKFPQAHIVSNEQVTTSLQQAGVQATYRGTETNCCKPFDAPHASIEPLGVTAHSTGYHFKNMLSHPGDSHSFSETKQILAMPFVSPWGSVMDAQKLVYELKPEHVIPIHDWHYRLEARTGLYQRLQGQFAQHSIKLILSEDDQSIEL